MEKRGINFEQELIVPNKDLPFKLFIFEGKDGKYVRDRHWHRAIEIFACFEGSFYFFINEEKYSVHQREFMLVNSNEVHSVVTPTPNKIVVMQIPLETFEQYYTDDQFISFSHSPHNQDEQIMNLIDDLYSTYHRHLFGYEMKVKSNFYQILYLLVTKYRNTDVSPELVKQHKKLSKLTIITAYIRENYKKDLSLEGLADIFGYSPTYLSRMFQKYAQINYKTYLQGVRVEYARNELIQTEHTISDIATLNGFPNSKAFTRAFKQKYGLLPSDYRKKAEKL